MAVAAAAAADKKQNRGPTIAPLNGSVVNTVIDSSSGEEDLSLAFRVCSNPKPHRVHWATPVYALRPGESSPDGGLVAGNMTRTPDDVTCYTLTLKVRQPSPTGEYVLVARNDHGLADGVVVLRNPATDSSSYTSSAAANAAIPMTILVASAMAYSILLL